jgi:GTP:adenosylcobinamide-phosphate guanylyltransferase
MDAIVIAGGIPLPEEPLFPFTKGKPKAMLDICGKPMIQWVLDALDGAKTIDQVVVIGMDEQDGLHSSKLHGFLPDQGSMLENIRHGTLELVRRNPSVGHVVVASSDIPAILPEQIDWVVQTASQTDLDFYYNVVSRQVMESRFPGSNRSYVHLKDIELCGGDLNVIRASKVAGNDEIWEKIINSRKNAFKQAALIGYDTLILLLLRLITLNAAIKKVSGRLHITGQALICPYAEVAMDVDKPHQLEIMRTDLCRRVQSG